jgi:hypothetical protein
MPASLESWSEVLVVSCEELFTTDGAGFELPMSEFLKARPPVRFDARLLEPFELWIADEGAEDGRRTPRDEYEFLGRLMGGDAGIGRHVADLQRQVGEQDTAHGRAGAK